MPRTCAILLTMEQDLKMQKTLAGLINDKEALSEYALCAQVADMYYNRGMKLSEIADALLFSTAKVSRLLSAARKKGVVEIRVHRALDRIRDLEKKMIERFGLTDAVVIGSYGNETYEEELDAVTDFAAVYVSELLKGQLTLGISNGESVNRVVRKIHPAHPCELDIVQVMGSGGGAHHDIESRDLATRIAGVYPGGRTFFLNAPLYIENSMARDELLREGAVASAFSRMRDCDLLLTGIGSFGLARPETPIIIREYLTRTHMDELSLSGAVGCICAQFFDETGTCIPCTWNSNCVSMALADVKRNPMTVVVCSGEKKILPVKAALQGGLINVLITSAHVATGVLSTS